MRSHCIFHLATGIAQSAEERHLDPQHTSGQGLAPGSGVERQPTRRRALALNSGFSLPGQVETGRESHNLFPVGLCSSGNFLMYLFHLRSVLWEPSTSITRTSCRTRILPLNPRAGLGLAGSSLGHNSKTLISQVASVLCLKLQKHWEEKSSCLWMRTQNTTDTHRKLAHLPTHRPAWSGAGSQLHSSSL